VDKPGLSPPVLRFFVWVFDVDPVWLAERTCHTTPVQVSARGAADVAALSACVQGFTERGGIEMNTNDVGKSLTRQGWSSDRSNSHSPIQEIFTVDTITYIRSAVVSKPPTSQTRTLKENFMDSEQLLAEIREANLTYLMLAQNLIRKDRAEALYRLGITEDAADLLGMLSTAQMLKIASSNMLLCRFRVDDDLVWNLLTNHNVKKMDNSTTTQLHASILMSGRFAESMTAAH